MFYQIKMFYHYLESHTRIFLVLIFAVAVAIRLLFFPQNIYFGFDQARDAYESQTIYKNRDLKIVGPPTANPDLFHGPLYWYLIGPMYLLGNGDPTIPAMFLRLYNAIGVFLIFWIGKMLFGLRTGLVAALLYAFSFEQTQYAIYFHHPPLAVLTIMLFYGGFTLAIFRKDWRGIPLSLLGYGLSMQAEFQLPYLGVVFLLLFLIFRRTLLPLVRFRTVVSALLLFVLATSTFILAEFKFGARTIRGILGLLSKAGQGEGDFGFAFNTYARRLVLQIHDNILGVEVLGLPLLLLLLGTVLFYIWSKRRNYQGLLFLLIWFISTGILTVFGPIPLYYTNVGLSPATLLLASFFLVKISEEMHWTLPLALALIIFSNISLIWQQNRLGVISDIQVQAGMLLGREEPVIDYMYQTAGGKPIVVSASTMPLKINTTWAYLFGWYGQKEYGYLPYWAGEVAPGYPGSLPSWRSQEEDYVMFSIVEPTRGVRQAFIDQFLESQEQYGSILEEKRLGDSPQTQLVVQRRR